MISKGSKFYRLTQNGQNDPELQLVEDVIQNYNPIHTSDEQFIALSAVWENGFRRILKLDHNGKRVPNFAEIKEYHPTLYCADANGGFIMSIADSVTYRRSIRHYDGNGILDNSFITPDFNYSDVYRLKSGKYLIEVEYDSDNYEVFRLNADGTLDNSYTSIKLFDPAFEMLESDAGNIYFQADESPTSEEIKIIYKLLPDGGFDKTYFTPKSLQNTRLALQSDGKLLVGGMPLSPEWIYMVKRYNENGTTDSSFTPINHTGLNDLQVDKYDKIFLAQTGSVSCFPKNGGTEPIMSADVDLEPQKILQQKDGKFLFFGAFCTYNLTPRQGSVRLHNSATAGIETNPAVNDKWQSYPNPVSTNLILSNSKSHGPVLISIHNQSGQLVSITLYKQSKENILINTEEWSCGVYTIQLVSPDGTEVLKVVKQ